MKKSNISKSHLFLLFVGLILSFTMSAQVGGWKADLVKDSNETLSSMLEKSSKLQSYNDQAYGYVVFPKITKAGLGIGGAAGQGIVFKNNTVVGSSKLKQASIGLQAGGQQYSEVIFFENKKSFEHFTNGKLKFDAQATAVAIKKGVALDVAYIDGVAVFTQAIGGLMFEASLGGQHFKYIPK